MKALRVARPAGDHGVGRGPRPQAALELRALLAGHLLDQVAKARVGVLLHPDRPLGLEHHQVRRADPVEVQEPGLRPAPARGGGRRRTPGCRPAGSPRPRRRPAAGAGRRRAARAPSPRARAARPRPRGCRWRRAPSGCARCRPRQPRRASRAGQPSERRRTAPADVRRERPERRRKAQPPLRQLPFQPRRQLRAPAVQRDHQALVVEAPGLGGVVVRVHDQRAAARAGCRRGRRR